MPRRVAVVAQAAALAMALLDPGSARAASPDWWREATGSAPSASPGAQASTVKSRAVDVIQPCGSDRSAGCQASRLNWADGYLEVRAEATADQRTCVNQAHCYSIAEKTARHLAYEKLAETLDGVSVDSYTVIGNMLMTSSELRTKVVGLVKGAREIRVDRRVEADGSVMVGVSLAIGLTPQGSAYIKAPATQAVSQAIDGWCVDPTTKQAGPCGKQAYAPARPSAPYAASAASPYAASAPAPYAASAVAAAPYADCGAGRPSPQPPAGRRAYSGIVLDARGLGAHPALRPLVRSRGGRIVYSDETVRPAMQERGGAFEWAGSIDEARTRDRVGDDPLVVPAICVVGAQRTELVIEDGYADLIDATVTAKRLWKRAPVVVVID